MDTEQKHETLSDYALTLIKTKAFKLVGSAGYTMADFDDIKQELTIDLLDRIERFDPARASFNTFVDRVVCRKVCSLIRFRQTAMRDHRLEKFSLNEEIEIGENDQVQRLETISQDAVDERTGRYEYPAAERACIHIDLAAAFARLTPELRRIAEMLCSDSVTEVARKLGIPRRTFRCKHLACLRLVFAEAGLSGYFA